MHGRSLTPVLRATTPADWRTDFIYEYEWEPDYPYTPTIVGLRTQTHSLMHSTGESGISVNSTTCALTRTK